ncbi:hypothetical protein ACPVPU_00335 [Sphingomonas sp. CJ99]
MDDTVIGRRNGAYRRRRAKANAFSAEKRQAFLDALALTCNARLSAQYAGVDHTTPYYHRTRDPVFLEQWQDALRLGYDRLEELVLRHGGAGQPLMLADPDRAAAAAGEGDADLPPFDFDRALTVLRQYRSRRDDRPFNHGGRPLKPVPREQTDAALDKALLAAERRMRRQPGRCTDPKPPEGNPQ